MTGGLQQQMVSKGELKLKTFAGFLNKKYIMKCYPCVMFLSVLDRTAKLLTLTEDKSGDALKGGRW